MGSSLTSSIMPTVFALSGASDLPSSSKDAPIAPNLRTNRVVPPAPGKRPTRISKPDFCFDYLRQRCGAWTLGVPDRSHCRPRQNGRHRFTALFCFEIHAASSILRNTPCICIMPSNTPLAGLSPAAAFICARTLGPFLRRNLFPAGDDDPFDGLIS